MRTELPGGTSAEGGALAEIAGRVAREVAGRDEDRPRLIVGVDVARGRAQPEEERTAAVRRYDRTADDLGSPAGSDLGACPDVRDRRSGGREERRGDRPLRGRRLRRPAAVDRPRNAHRNEGNQEQQASSQRDSCGSHTDVMAPRLGHLVPVYEQGPMPQSALHQSLRSRDGPFINSPLLRSARSIASKARTRRRFRSASPAATVVLGGAARDREPRRHARRVARPGSGEGILLTDR